MASSAVDVSDPAVQAAWKELTNDKAPTNWIVLGLADGGRSNRLELVDSSSDGFVNLKKKLKSISARVLFGAFVVSALDHRSASTTSRRSKIVAFSYTGAATPELARAQSSFQKTAVNSALFTGAHLYLEVNAKDLDSTFNEKAIARRLHDATAAHKPTHYHFMDKGAAELSVEEFTKADDDSDDDFD